MEITQTLTENSEHHVLYRERSREVGENKLMWLQYSKFKLTFEPTFHMPRQENEERGRQN